MKTNVKPKNNPKPDLQFVNEGSIFLLYARSKDGQAWIEQNLPDDATRWGEAVVIEHRYAWDIYQGALGDGMNVI